MPDSPVRYRVCLGPCQQKLEIEKFDRDESKPDGYRTWCKECRKTKQALAKVTDIQESILEAVDRMDEKTLLLIKDAAGGSNMPHKVELVEAFLDIFGGHRGLIAFYVGQILAAKPGSVVRERMLNTFVRLIETCSEDARVSKPRSLADTEDLEKRIIDFVKPKIMDVDFEKKESA